jgi:hypothetical protein
MSCNIQANREILVESILDEAPAPNFGDLTAPGAKVRFVKLGTILSLFKKGEKHTVPTWIPVLPIFRLQYIEKRKLLGETDGDMVSVKSFEV